jgi:hypothetical protein
MKGGAYKIWCIPSARSIPGVLTTFPARAPRHQLQMDGQLNTPASLLPGKELSVPIV